MAAGRVAIHRYGDGYAPGRFCPDESVPDCWPGCCGSGGCWPAICQPAGPWETGRATVKGSNRLRYGSTTRAIRPPTTSRISSAGATGRTRTTIQMATVAALWPTVVSAPVLDRLRFVGVGGHRSALCCSTRAGPSFCGHRMEDAALAPAVPGERHRGAASRSGIGEWRWVRALWGGAGA